VGVKSEFFSGGGARYRAHDLPSTCVTDIRVAVVTRTLFYFRHTLNKRVLMVRLL